MANEKKLSSVIHRRKLLGDNDLQVDEFTIKIPIGCLSANGIRKLSYWCVEELDRAYLDWETGEIVLEYTTEHYLPSGYADEYGVEEFEEVV